MGRGCAQRGVLRGQALQGLKRGSQAALRLTLQRSDSGLDRVVTPEVGQKGRGAECHILGVVWSARVA